MLLEEFRVREQVERAAVGDDAAVGEQDRPRAMLPREVEIVGGDEFVVVLPRTSSADARSLAERMLRNFRDVLAKEVPEANIASLSIGLASREEDQPMQAMDLVHLADEALYLAKAGGKNRITVLRPGAVHVRATA